MSSSKAKDKDPNKTPVLKGQEAEDKILDYMKRCNRPYGAVDVAANLKGAVPKTATQKILVALAEKGDLIQKTYGDTLGLGKTTFFVYNQDKLPALPNDKIADLKVELGNVEESNKALAAKIKALSGELAVVRTSLTNDEIVKQTSEMGASITQMTATLEPLRAGAPPVSAEELEKLSPIRRKLVIVGDGMCLRKDIFIMRFRPWRVPERLSTKYILSIKTCQYTSLNFFTLAVFDNYVAEIRLDEKPVQLALWDTAGQEEYERLRPMSYSKSHVILIAFAIDTPDSLDNVTTKWNEEVRSICGPTIPVILVGCKADLRPSTDHPDTPDNPCPWVTREKGERVANAIGARAYKECSALKIEGVDDVFETATRASMLMRNGVPGHSPSENVESKHHRRRSSGKGTVSEKEEGRNWACCVVC
ncbi:hypothetical protein CVT24_004068 [Panaeolus cyanescens]|uniref:Homologous-pairing protein 2 winged helix domain-containing protein n=1 Tax=Panaeolus cyanescens TaxID=181874 RepID=A0A409Y5Z1_9AGAR|nr:hypothetical protein CVT24_004068 [Panaeolus cyanescens]